MKLCTPTESQEPPCETAASQKEMSFWNGSVNYANKTPFKKLLHMYNYSQQVWMKSVTLARGNLHSEMKPFTPTESPRGVLACLGGATRRTARHYQDQIYHEYETIDYISYHLSPGLNEKRNLGTWEFTSWDEAMYTNWKSGGLSVRRRRPKKTAPLSRTTSSVETSATTSNRQDNFGFSSNNYCLT